MIGTRLWRSLGRGRSWWHLLRPVCSFAEYIEKKLLDREFAVRSLLAGLGTPTLIDQLYVLD